MSVKMMAAVWEGYPGGGSDLLALLALADWADDDGRCWPSIAALGTKCRLSRSQTQRVVHRLIADGHLVVEGNAAGGPPGATRRYRIAADSFTRSVDAPDRANSTPAGRMDATGSADATGRIHAQDGSHPCAETGRTDATQTISEPSVNRQQVNARMRKPKSSSSAKSRFDPHKHLVDLGVDEQVVADYIALRKAKRAPVTATVVRDIIREAGKAGIPLEGALRTCCRNGWQGFNADWLTSRSQQTARRAPTPENFASVDYGQGGLI